MTQNYDMLFNGMEEQSEILNEVSNFMNLF